MTLINITRYDKGIVANTETELTEEGYIKARVIVTRCGVFLYRNADGSVRKELRHPDEVLKEDSLETIKMIPIVNGHPPEKLVSAENAKRLSVGFTGELVESEYPHVISNLLITDKKTVTDIKEKRKNELSLGYTVDLKPESGTYNGEPYDCIQTNIKYNHLAIVDEARAGPEARIALDGYDAEIILNGESKMTAKSKRKVKIDAEEYLMEDDAATKFENLMEKHQDLMGEHERLKGEHEKMMAERDSLRDKDHHDPEKVHHPLSKDRGMEEEEMMDDDEEMEEDEIGENGKEMPEPTDGYGLQSHVKDYEKPSHLENHVVKSPKNRHYPNDLPHIAKVDSAEINKRVKNRVKLEKLAERYLDKKSLARIDSMSDFDLKKSLIQTMQPNANLNGKSEIYINARFDSVVEDMPKSKVLANPSSYNSDSQDEKDGADANQARINMIKRLKNAYKGNK